jgi:preprotein translocase subunit SecA
MFEELTRSIREETVRTLFRVALVQEPGTSGPPPGRPAGGPGAPEAAPARVAPGGRIGAKPPAAQRQELSHASVSAFGTPAATPSPERPRGPRQPAAPGPAPVVSHEPKVGRNDPCPCGSGKKYKKCHGA